MDQGGFHPRAGYTIVLAAHDDRAREYLCRIVYRQLRVHVNIGAVGGRIVQLGNSFCKCVDNVVVRCARVIVIEV